MNANRPDNFGIVSLPSLYYFPYLRSTGKPLIGTCVPKTRHEESSLTIFSVMSLLCVRYSGESLWFPKIGSRHLTGRAGGEPLWLRRTAGMRSARLGTHLVVIAALRLWRSPREARSSGVEVKVERDFLAGVVEKVPPFPFDHQDRYRGTAGGFRLLGIDPKTRQFHVLCKLEGEYRDRIGRGKNSAGAPRWKKFRFEVRASIRIEPGNDGTPRFAVTIDDVKREEMKVSRGRSRRSWGASFDLLVTKIAAGKAAS